MFLSFDFKLKDRRVDRILTANGFESVITIYNPITGWLFYYLLILLAIYGMLFTAFPSLVAWSTPFLLILFYLSFAHGGYSVALSKKQLAFINPNFPFRNSSFINLKEVKHVTTTPANQNLLQSLFQWEKRRIRVTMNNASEQTFFTSIEWESFDENITESHLDDLIEALEEQSIPVNVTY